MRTRLMGAAAMLICFSATARAQEPPPPPAAVPAPAPSVGTGAAEFGAQGQFALDVDLPLQNEAPEFAIIHASTNMGGGSVTAVAIQPSLDYFVAPHISVGGLVGYAHDSASSDVVGSGSATATVLTVGVRGGYDVHLSDLVSIWGRLEFVYEHVSVSGGSSGYVIPLIINIPILVHPAPHFFLGAGPMFTTELVSKAGGQDTAKTTDFGVQAIIGGYFGGA